MTKLGNVINIGTYSLVGYTIYKLFPTIKGGFNLLNSTFRKINKFSAFSEKVINAPLVTEKDKNFNFKPRTLEEAKKQGKEAEFIGILKGRPFNLNDFNINSNKKISKANFKSKINIVNFNKMNKKKIIARAIKKNDNRPHQIINGRVYATTSKTYYKNNKPFKTVKF